MQIVGCDTFFQFLERKMPQPESNKGWKSDPMTEKQRLMLRSLGLGFCQLKTKGQASAIISVAIERKRNGMATPGQMWALRELGLNSGLFMWTYQQAEGYLRVNNFRGHRRLYDRKKHERKEYRLC